MPQKCVPEKKRVFVSKRVSLLVAKKKDAIDEHVILEIGGLSDITQFCKSADLNGLLEINVG